MVGASAAFLLLWKSYLWGSDVTTLAFVVFLKKLARVTVLVACPGVFPGALPSLQQVGLLQQQQQQQYISCCAAVWENGD